MYLYISTFCFFVVWKTSMGAPKMGGLLFDPLYHEASTPPTINKKIVPSDYLQTILRDASKHNRTITSKKIVLPPNFLQSLLKRFSNQYTKSSLDTTTSPVVIFLSFLQNPSNNITAAVKVPENLSTTISKTTKQHQSPLIANLTKQNKNDIFVTKTFKTSTKLKPILTSKPSVNYNYSNKAVERNMQASTKDSNVSRIDNTRYTTMDTADNILILLKKVLEHSATIDNAQATATNHVKPLIRNFIDHNDTTTKSPTLNDNLKTFINSTSEIKTTTKDIQKHLTTESSLLLPKNISKVQSTSTTPTANIDLRLKDILAMKLREARRIYVGYEFNDDQCQIINGRINCGYDKNVGKAVDVTAFADAGNNCRYRADRLECGYGNSLPDTTTLVNPFFLRRVNTDGVVKNETIISTETTLQDGTITNSTSNTTSATTTTNPASRNSTEPLTEQQDSSIKKTSCVDMVDRIVCYDVP